MFDGRVTRSTYFWFNLVGAIPAAAAIVYDPSGIILWVYLLIYGIVHLSFAIRRLHDMDYSWLVVLLLFVPLANVVLYLILFFKDGTVGSNEYGVDPRGRRGRSNVPHVADFGPAPTTLSGPGPIDRLSALEKLGSLRERDLLTEAEYAAEKARLG